MGHLPFHRGLEGPREMTTSVPQAAEGVRQGPGTCWQALCSANGGEHLAKASAVRRWRGRNRVQPLTVLPGGEKGMVAREEDLRSELPFRS